MTQQKYITAGIASLAMAGAIALLAPRTPSRQPAAAAPAEAPATNRIQVYGPDTFEPRGYRRFVARFMWTAPAGEVAIWVSDGGTNWMQLGNQQAASGENEISLLIPEWYCQWPQARPRLRIGTPDRQYGFEAALDVLQVEE
jgi:hypothetical protein